MSVLSEAGEGGGVPPLAKRVRFSRIDFLERTARKHPCLYKKAMATTAKFVVNRGDQTVKTRHTLLERLKDWKDQEGWQEFFDIYWKLIYRVAIRSGLSAGEAEDVVQETMISVSRKIGEFRCDPAAGSFKTWLLNLTRWRISDQIRKRPAAYGQTVGFGEDNQLAGVVERIPDSSRPALESVWQDEWETNLFQVALGRLKRQVKPLQYQLFDLYVLKSWPVNRIKESLRVSRTQIYLAKHRISRLLRQEVKRLSEGFGASGH